MKRTATLTIATWNIRHGGGPRRSGIADAIGRFGADIVVLPEWSPNGTPDMRSLLEAQGWHVATPAVQLPSRHYGVAIASRASVRMGELTVSDMSRLLHVVVTTGGREIDVIGVYVPSGSGDMARKRTFLEELAGATAHWPDDRPAVMAGDFNCDHRDATGSLAPRLVGEPRFADLFAAGWTDAHRAVSDPMTATFWEPRGRVGFKIDHVLCRGPMLPRRSNVVTAVGDAMLAGEQRTDAALSDHAALVTSLQVAAGQ